MESKKNLFVLERLNLENLLDMIITSFSFYRQRLIGDLQSLTSSDQEVLAEYNRILDKKDENSA